MKRNNCGKALQIARAVHDIHALILGRAQTGPEKFVAMDVRQKRVGVSDWNFDEKYMNRRIDLI